MGNKITTYNEIFNQRIQRLVKQIKTLRKHPNGNKEKIKTCLKEAKQLKKKIQKANKTPDVIHEIVFEIEGSGFGYIKQTSPGLTISSVGHVENDLTIRFTVDK